MAVSKPTKEIGQLPNGSTLSVEINESGGLRFWSDEVAGGVCVWDTSLVDSGTLLAALAEARTWNLPNTRSPKAPQKVQPPKAKPMGPKRVPANGEQHAIVVPDAPAGTSPSRQVLATQQFTPIHEVIPQQQASFTDDMLDELHELSEEEEIPPAPLDDYDIWEPRLKMWFRDKMWMKDKWGPAPRP
jgi:hypothetical protein